MIKFSINLLSINYLLNVILINLLISIISNKAAGLRPTTLLKRDSDTCVFLLILRNF